MPDVGQQAPDFTLPDTARDEVSLSDHRGKNVVLAFLPGAFTGVCTAEVCALRDNMAAFEDMDADVLGISVDSPFANGGFARVNDVNFPLLSDFDRSVTKAYDVALANFAGLEGYTVAQRSVFVLDGDGIVRWRWIADNPGQQPDYDAVKAAVAAL